jgi:hypothetical protein
MTVCYMYFKLQDRPNGQRIDISMSPVSETICCQTL